jgi:hypothetical protein
MDALKRRVGAMCAVVAFGVLAVIGLGLGVIDWFESRKKLVTQAKAMARRVRIQLASLAPPEL